MSNNILTLVLVKFVKHLINKKTRVINLLLLLLLKSKEEKRGYLF